MLKIHMFVIKRLQNILKKTKIKMLKMKVRSRNLYVHAEKMLDWHNIPSKIIPMFLLSIKGFFSKRCSAVEALESLLHVVFIALKPCCGVCMDN